MRNAIVDYAIPKSRMDQARARDLKYKSGSAVAALHHEAIGTFTDLSNTGEGGEILLYKSACRTLSRSTASTLQNGPQELIFACIIMGRTVYTPH